MTCITSPLLTRTFPLAFCPNPVTVVNETSLNVSDAALPPGTAVPAGVYPTPALVNVKVV